MQAMVRKVAFDKIEHRRGRGDEARRTRADRANAGSVDEFGLC